MKSPVNVVNFIYDAKILLPLNIVVGSERLEEMPWGDTKHHLIEVLSLNTYYLIDVTCYIT